jgi:catalase
MFCAREFPKREQAISRVGQGSAALGKDVGAAPDLKPGHAARAGGQAMSELPIPAATPAAVVDALKAVAGNPPKVRAIFAKGRCVRGTYAPSDHAAEITRSLSFTRPSRVLARFSVGGGNPGVTDTNNLVLRGFSFRLGDDAHRSDILTETAPVHFARTLDQMFAFLEARIPGADGQA